MLLKTNAAENYSGNLRVLGFYWTHNLLGKFTIIKISLFCVPGCPEADSLIWIVDSLH